MSRVVLALRALVGVSGVLALLPGWAPGVPAGAVLLGLLGLAGAVLRPGSAAPAGVLVAAAVAWTAKHGTDLPPAAATLLVASAVATHHQAAALAAALPAAARVDRAVLVRFARHAGLVLVLSAVVAGLALGLPDRPGSVPLELLGLAAAVLAAALPVLLGRSDRRR